MATAWRISLSLGETTSKNRIVTMRDENRADFSLVLASSVHDMKNSLGMLLTSLEDVIRDAPARDQKQAEQFATLQYEASRINTELVQLLSLYRMQNDRLPLHVDEHYLIDVLEEQVARNDMLFSTRNIEVELDCDEGLSWYYDSELLGSVIHNVIVNCARYSKKKMLLKAEANDNSLKISIADDGDGYPEFMLDNPEQSFDQAVNFSSGSTHLGLYFAQKVAQMHRRHDQCGSIALSNNGPLGGGLFIITLP